MPLNDLEGRVRDAIAARSERMLAELAAHVAIPTGQNYTAGLEHYRSLLSARLQKLGATIAFVPGAPRPAWLTPPGPQRDISVPPLPEQIPATLIASHQGRRASKRILLAGHLDTVHDPRGAFQSLTVSEDGKTAVGPGVVDMKGGILIAVTALEALAEHAFHFNWTFLLNSDEETGSFHSFDAISRAAREHDIGMALEPALPDGSLVVSRFGAGQFRIEVFGRSAHVGRDFTQGISAVNALAEIILKVAKLNTPKRDIIINIGPLHGGSATNIVPDYAACWGNVRFGDPALVKEVEQQLDSFNTSDDALPRVKVHHLMNRPAKPLTPQVQELADLAREVANDLGQQLPFGSTGGVCDGNIMQHAGLPTIDTLGVRGGNLHRTDEFIELESLVERCQLLAILLMRVA